MNAAHLETRADGRAAGTAGARVARPEVAAPLALARACLDCGFELPAGAGFCRRCGKAQ